MMPINFQAAMKESLLEAPEEREAIRRWQVEGDRAALEVLLRSHARQAWSLASRWSDNPAHLEDLAAEGMIGLIRAADSFDLDQDVRFSTYAAWWVMNGISSAVARIKSVIDVPSRALVEMRSGKLTDEDHAMVQMAMQGIVALDAPVGDGTLSLLDALVSAERNPEEEAAAESLHLAQQDLIARALNVLNYDEAEVIRRRRLQAVPDSIDDVAEAMRMSRDKLRQVERRALTRLRRVLLENGFHRTMLN